MSTLTTKELLEYERKENERLTKEVAKWKKRAEKMGDRSEDMLDRNLVLHKALFEIYEKSSDNWAAARAETGLGIGKIAVLSENGEKK